MSQSRNESRVKLDLNNEIFQQNLLSLDKTKRNRVLDTLKKLLRLTWNQVYRDQGLKWEKISSVLPPQGVDSLYSLRITQARRATAYRSGDFIRFLTIQPDHDTASLSSKIGCDVGSSDGVGYRRIAKPTCTRPKETQRESIMQHVQPNTQAHSTHGL